MLGIALLCLLPVLYLFLVRKQPRLPPGPRPLPFIGNLHQAPRETPWLEYQKWHKAYGPIVSFKLGQQVFVLLGTHDVVHELLDKRSAIYSSRPRSIVAGECITKGLGIIFLPYGARWRMQHRTQAEFLIPRIAQEYSGLQDIETRQVVYDFLHTSDFNTSFHRLASSLIFALAYGKRFAQGDEDEIREIDELMSRLTEKMTPGKWMVDIFPILNYLPRFMAPWKRVGDELHERHEKLFVDNMTNAQNASSWNWSKVIMGLKDTSKFSTIELAYMIGVLYEAGSDTTAITLDDFIAACLLNPEAVNKAQEELDSVVGPDRLPDADDLAKLRYTNGFLLGSMRQRPIMPFGIPHATTRDDEYMGYHIPKGAAVLANVWCLGADEEVFENPGSFMPERWVENPKLPVSSFGFGRRVCTGRHIAMNSLRLTVARVLWAYNIGHAYENGRRVEIDPLARTQDAITKPVPFKADLQIRSQGHRHVVEASWLNAEKDLDVTLGGVGASRRSAQNFEGN